MGKKLAENGEALVVELTGAARVERWVSDRVAAANRPEETAIPRVFHASW
jgi:hypothetical protein